MSVAVAVKKSGKLVLATDSRSTKYGYEQQPAENCVPTKVVRVGDALIAATGHMIVLDVLALVDAPKEPLQSVKAVMEYFAHTWYCLETGLRLVSPRYSDDEDGFLETGMQFLVVTDAIYEVDQTFRVRRMERYAAIGSGSEYAYGSLVSLYDRLDDAEQIARDAVSAAIAFDVKCGGETEVVSV